MNFEGHFKKEFHEAVSDVFHDLSNEDYGIILDNEDELRQMFVTELLRSQKENVMEWLEGKKLEQQKRAERLAV